MKHSNQTVIIYLNGMTQAELKADISAMRAENQVLLERIEAVKENIKKGEAEIAMAEVE